MLTRVANVAPDSLDLNGTSILENQPVGTRVGQLLAPIQMPMRLFILHWLREIFREEMFISPLIRMEASSPQWVLIMKIMSPIFRCVCRWQTSTISRSKTFTIHLLNQNELPYDLTDPSLLRIEENQPAGTRVGDIVFADPDHGSVLDYVLVSGAFDNQSFTLDANGTIRSARTFDYELNSSRTIKIRVTDENNASVENDYSIAVINVVEDLDGDGVEKIITIPMMMGMDLPILRN